MVIASVHLADVGVRALPNVLRRAPRAGAMPGLRHANVAMAAPLRKAPIPGRIGYLSFWDDDAALDEFLSSPFAQKLSSGWSARLEPLRMHGAWPGMPETTPAGRSVDYDGPAVVATVARTNMTRVVPFLRTSAPAERAVLTAPGLVWATAMALPPFFSTISLWADAKSILGYAYGQKQPAHSEAMAADAKKPFHRENAFIRFRPYDVRGSLEGKNPLPEGAVVV